MTYATLDDLKDMMRVTDTTDDAILTAALTSATSKIDGYCGRVFTQDSVASARHFDCPPDWICLAADDFWTTTGLIVATGNDGTYGTSFSAYELEPIDGVGPNGHSGWPYSTIRLVNAFFFPPVPFGRRQTVQITAKWGWAAVPDEVELACKMLAHALYRSKDAPFGAVGTTGGVIGITQSQFIVDLLEPYRLASAFSGIA